MATVEPYINPKGVLEPGVWKFVCDCGYQDLKFGCSRLVNDSEPNFTCERPIQDPSDTKCKFRHKLAPLIAAWQKWRAEEDTREFLAPEKAKREAALKTLGLTEAQVNTAATPPLSSSTSAEVQNGG